MTGCATATAGLAPIVTVAVPSEIVAFELTLLSFSVNRDVGFAPVSKIGTTIVFAVWPGANLTVPLTGP